MILGLGSKKKDEAINDFGYMNFQIVFFDIDDLRRFNILGT